MYLDRAAKLAFKKYCKAYQGETTVRDTICQSAVPNAHANSGNEKYRRGRGAGKARVTSRGRGTQNPAHAPGESTTREIFLLCFSIFYSAHRPAFYFRDATDGLAAARFITPPHPLLKLPFYTTTTSSSTLSSALSAAPRFHSSPPTPPLLLCFRFRSSRRS